MIQSAPLKKGIILEGVVKSITDFGAFIDIGGLKLGPNRWDVTGIDGLLHISQISHQPIQHAAQVLAIGERVNVVVLRYDSQRKKVSLGRKQLVNPRLEAKVNKLTKKALYALRKKVEGVNLGSSHIAPDKKADIFERAAFKAKKATFVQGGIPSLGRRR